MSSFPVTFEESTRPLTKELLDHKTDESIDRLAAAGYEVHYGLTKDFAADIIQMSLESAIKEYCPNDCGKRFKDLVATEDWLKKGRGTFLLLKKTDGGSLSLAGYGWAGDGESSHVPGGETTFAIRIGEAGQGQGLATPFAWLIVAGAAKIYEARKFWLETWQSNEGAVHIYHKIGFVDVDFQQDKRPTNTGGEVDDVRLYMSLADNLLPVNAAALSSDS